MRITGKAVVVLTALALCQPLRAQDSSAVRSLETGGFTFVRKVTVPVAPDVAYDLATGDLKGWWDHTMSERPVQLCIEPRVGGGFWELFDSAGNGVRHAVVTYAQRGQRLRFEGPLGLGGNAVHMVHTYAFVPIAGGGTELTVTVAAAGQMEREWPQLVAGVWDHFLGRYRDYVGAFHASGRQDERPTQCGPQ